MKVSIAIGELIFQIIPKIDSCTVLKNGVIIWSGNRENLTKILNNVYGKEKS